jgi:pyruvate dehydrogenase E2 component (dihydrolipoamide acetyltransferase)
MATRVTMPRLSDTMTEGTVAKWLKKVGDSVKEGDILAEIETDKATMEFESFNAGTLLHIGIPEGETASVDSLLAIIGKEGEDITALLQGNNQSNEVSDLQPTTKQSEPLPAVALPKGVTVVTMPRLSDTMTEGTVARWLKKVGDSVKEGDILAEIETDKATMEFESFNAGTLLYIGIQEGQSAPIDSVLAIIGPAGADITGIAENYVKGSPEKSTMPIEPQKSEAPAQQVTKSSNERIFISPLARKIAEEKGIDIEKISGSGENGRIVKADVENFKMVISPSVAIDIPMNKEENVAYSEVRPFVPAGEKYIEEVKNSQMRKTIARRLSESKFTAPHYYLTIEIPMDHAMTSRETINSMHNIKVSFNDMVIKACAMALKRHPKVNSQWKEEITIVNHHVHVGVAVAVEDGLVVPVLNFTDQMTLTQIGAGVRDLASRAKTKKLQPSEMEGSTFTVSNLGMFGISEFTSIINQPNSAILSVGAIEEKPVVRNGQIVVGHTMKVTLACDHRTVDGSTGAQFLQTLRTYLENPVTMLA